MIIKIQQNELFANEFRKWFLFVLKHELIHRGQNLAVKDTKLLARVMVKEFGNEKEYLSDKQEIMARAWETIELFKFQGFTKKRIAHILVNEIYNSENGVLQAYIKTFDKNSNVYKLFFKYLYLYLEEN